MADEQAPSANKRAAVKAATSKTPTVRVGEVASLVVQSPTGRPTFRVSGQSEAVYARRSPDSDAWTAAWVPTKPGDHDVTVTADDADPVVFIITATSQEG